MALPSVYFLYFTISANGQQFVPVFCDLAPAWVAKDVYSTPYRDLSAQGVGGVVDIPASTLVLETDVATQTQKVVVLADAESSVADDVSHIGFRQDPPHKEDVLVFTDSLGNLCGEFDGEQYPNWSDAGPPNSVPTKFTRISTAAT